MGAFNDRTSSESGSSAEIGLLKDIHGLDRDEEIDQTRLFPNKPRRGTMGSYLPWFLHLVVLAMYTTLLFSKESPKCPKAFPTELESVEGWIEYEDIVFKSSGFHDQNISVDPYEGPLSPETNSKWLQLQDVGIYRLTAAENAQLPTSTAFDLEHPDNYIVVIAMFHQIHCLDQIRHVAYGDVNPYNEPESVVKMHLDHCVDYLRQVLMCHGDTTPITVYHDYTHDPPKWRTNWEIHHTCRNYDKLHEWALQRNDTGYGI
ncbi:hypothetical protein F5884DRAFT_779139 [Xylogone sp. PMI_703]|nr:hypothetical protein F5884DRAFT_779139 [Xylogone sp. PMI_703]